MAKSAKTINQTNNYDGKTVDKFITAAMEKYQELDDKAGAHMNACSKIRKSIASIVEEAKAVGIPKPAMRAQIKLELHKKKMRRIIEDMENEQKAEVRQIVEARQDLVQMNLFGWAPPMTKVERDKRSKLRSKKFGGATGSDIEEAIAADEAASGADTEDGAATLQ